jgi:Flp pilus assembly protein TadD
MVQGIRQDYPPLLLALLIAGLAGLPAGHSGIAIAASTPTNKLQSPDDKLLEQADNLAGTGKYEQAVIIYQKLSAAAKPNPRALHMYGRTLALEKKYPEAAEQYRRALEYIPNNAELLNDLGVVLTASGKPAEALGLLRKAIALSPDYVTAYNNLGSTYMTLGKYDAAAKVFHISLGYQPTNSRIRKRLNDCLLSLVKQSESYSNDPLAQEDYASMLSRATEQEDEGYLKLDTAIKQQGQAGQGSGQTAVAPTKPIVAQVQKLPKQGLGAGQAGSMPAQTDLEEEGEEEDAEAAEAKEQQGPVVKDWTQD